MTEGLDAAQSEPHGTLSIRTLAMPADTNQYGDIFGGWLLGQMDIAGGIVAANIAKSRTATVAVDAMTFRKPVYVGDVMCIYTDLIRRRASAPARAAIEGPCNATSSPVLPENYIRA